MVTDMNPWLETLVLVKMSRWRAEGERTWNARRFHVYRQSTYGAHTEHLYAIGGL